MWRFIKSIPRSVIAFLIALVLGFLSMGVLGGALYYAVLFAIPSSFPHIDSIGGDWVWPAVITVGMLWSFGFLMAGVINKHWSMLGARKSMKRIGYVVVLWLWAYVLWVMALYLRTT